MPELSSAALAAETAIPVIRTKLEKILLVNFMIVVNLLSGITNLIEKGWSPNRLMFKISG